MADIQIPDTFLWITEADVCDLIDLSGSAEIGVGPDLGPHQAVAGELGAGDVERSHVPHGLGLGHVDGLAVGLKGEPLLQRLHRTG